MKKKYFGLWFIPKMLHKFILNLILCLLNVKSTYFYCKYEYRLN